MELMSFQEDWWKVVESMANLVACGYDYDELEDDMVQVALQGQGYTRKSIEEALDWLEMASNSGNIADVFSMLLPSAGSVRVASPLEKVCISDKLWLHLENIRNRGIISDDLAERLLEGIRGLDTRDWEDDEVRAFIEEVISTSMPHVDSKTIQRLLLRRPAPEFYS